MSNSLPRFQINLEYPSRMLSGFFHEFFQESIRMDLRTDFSRSILSYHAVGVIRLPNLRRQLLQFFADVFGLRAEHIGQKGIVPDIVVASRDEKWAGILDTKSYKKKYSISNDHKNRMLEYIERYSEYGLEFANLSFFAYVVSDYGKNIKFSTREYFE